MDKLTDRQAVLARQRHKKDRETGTQTDKLTAAEQGHGRGQSDKQADRQAGGK